MSLDGRLIIEITASKEKKKILGLIFHAQAKLVILKLQSYWT